MRVAQDRQNRRNAIAVSHFVQDSQELDPRRLRQVVVGDEPNHAAVRVAASQPAGDSQHERVGRAVAPDFFEDGA